MPLTPSRSETAANWITQNTILAFGEVSIETDTGVVKLGDGKTRYVALNVVDLQQTSAQRAASVSDETGTGAAVYATSPTLVAPTVGVATATSVNKVTITAPTTSATLTLVTGSSLITSGAFSTTLTSTATTNVTLPTTGTLATLAGTETLSGKTLTSPVVNPTNSSSIGLIIAGVASQSASLQEWRDSSAVVVRSMSVTGIVGEGGTAGAPTLASATTITPTKAISFVSGITTIATITPPVPIDTLGGAIVLIPTGIFLTNTAGNIALASTSVVGRALRFVYDPVTGKFYPSY